MRSVMTSPSTIAMNAGATIATIFGAMGKMTAVPGTRPTIAATFWDEDRPHQRSIIDPGAQRMHNSGHRVDVIVMAAGLVIDALAAPRDTWPARSRWADPATRPRR